MSRRVPPPLERPTLFVPVEIKVREFRAKLLLAAVAARAGMRAYVGTKSAITAAVASRRHRAGIYFAKGGERLDVVHAATSHCEQVVMLDEELGPGLGADGVRRMWTNRHSADVEQRIDRIFLFSTAHQEALHELRPSLAGRTVVTGWPRADLWRQEFRTADERRAAEIRGRHGHFVLFASNFKVSSEGQRRHRAETARAERDRLPEPARSQRSTDHDFGSFATARLQGFERAVVALRELAAALDEPKLVVRPHPAEDPEDWRQALAGVRGTEVVFDGEAGPWLLAARALLHTGCTTAVEAAFYGTPCGYLAHVGYLTESFADTPAYRVSRRLDSTEDARGFLEVTPERRDAGPVPALSERELGPLRGRAVDRIVGELSALEITPEPPVSPQRGVSIRSFIGENYRHVKRLVPRPGGRRFYGANAQPKVPGGLHRREAQRLLSDLGQEREIVVTEPAPNLLCVEAPITDAVTDVDGVHHRPRGQPENRYPASSALCHPSARERGPPPRTAA